MAGYIESDPLSGVGYVCQWTGTERKCGCGDAACSANYSQLQTTGNPTSGGTTGETTGGTSALIEGFGSCDGKPTKPLPSFDFESVGYRGGAALPNKAATKTYAAGRYTITDILELKSGDVLRGAGRDKTLLYFPEGLKGMGSGCPAPNGNDCYDWTGGPISAAAGVITAEGSEIGIEDLTIEFPADHTWTHYAHTGNGGFNGIELQCDNCWVKNVTIKNSDNGIFVEWAKNVSLIGVHVYARPGGGHTHVAVTAKSVGTLVADFRMYGTSAHGLVINWGSENTVFANGWGENIDIEPDHACGAKDFPCNKNMLYSNISGKIRRFQTKDRAGNPVPAIRWNVGAVDRCPLDAYTLIDPDVDGDGVLNNVDNCPTVSSPDQADANGDGFGDACVSATIDLSGIEIGINPLVGPGTVFDSGVFIGDNAQIGADVQLKEAVEVGDDFVGGDETIVEENAIIGDDVMLGFKVKIERDVILQDGVEIGDESVVRKEATIHADTLLGAKVTVEDRVQIGERVLVGQDTKIAADATIGKDVVIGEGVTLQAGANVPDNTSIPDGETFP